jgi:diadenosine tetraphosphatase ApaH/serine/threonine PP2A family protein phosphatase
MPDGPQVSCVHGSLLDEDQYVLTVRDAWRPLHEAHTRLNFFGHTHVQGGFAANGDEWFRLSPQYGSRDEAEEYELPLRESARYLLNPGSVGQPRDGDWRAAFAVYDDDAKAVTFYRVPYNVREAQSRILRAGLPDRLATRLREGR